MALISYTVHHRTHGLEAVAQAARRIDGLALTLKKECPNLRGILLLSTCNRVEILLETISGSEVKLLDQKIIGALFPQTKIRSLSRFKTTSLKDEKPHPEKPTPPPRAPLQIRRDKEAVEHLFAVACGLDSMVVGEREISGQLRRALKVSQDQHLISPNLNRICEAALSTSRKVAHLTGLASQGRSVVGAALDLAVAEIGELNGKSALLIGTGSYAGASVSALRARNAGGIRVYSSSGRAQYFAQGHDLDPVAETELVDALRQAEIVISCRGLGSPVLKTASVELALKNRASDLIILDLALQSDLESQIKSLARVQVIDLSAVQQRFPEVAGHQIARAQEIIAQGVAELLCQLRERSMDAVVVALRDTYQQIVAEEISRLPAQGMLPREQVIYALRHLAARLAHTPTVNAHRAGRSGQGSAYVKALESVMGIEADLSTQTCPATGLNLQTLGEETVVKWQPEAL